MQDKVFGVQMLPKEFTDENWIAEELIYEDTVSELNDFRGKLVRRKRPVILSPFFTDYTCMTIPARLIIATIHHVIVESYGKQSILDCRFTDPDDWELWNE